MGYAAKYYDKKTLTEKVWHNSSMLKYTEMVEDPNENYGDLTVVFNNGSTYRYKNVRFEDYVLMIGGGIDGSNGKTFNKVVKEKNYAYERIEPMSQEEIDRGYRELMQKYAVKQDTYFISGPEDFTETEFESMVTQKLALTIDNDELSNYYIVDSEVFGRRVQGYLIEVLGVSPDKITVFKRRNEETHCAYPGVNINDEYDNDEEIDTNMTYWSSFDIVLLQDWENTLSRQAKNILRRYVYS